MDVAACNPLLAVVYLSLGVNSEQVCGQDVVDENFNKQFDEWGRFAPRSTGSVLLPKRDGAREAHTRLHDVREFHAQESRDEDTRGIAMDDLHERVVIVDSPFGGGAVDGVVFKNETVAFLQVKVWSQTTVGHDKVPMRAQERAKAKQPRPSGRSCVATVLKSFQRVCLGTSCRRHSAC